jgi:hypothetical protein
MKQLMSADKDDERMIEESLAWYEAMILRRDRYGSDAEYRKQVGMWLSLTRRSCDKLRRLLCNPTYADQYEEIRDVLAIRRARIQSLERIVCEDGE